MAATWKKIRQLREAAGISQGDLAREMKVSQTWLSARERGAALSKADAHRAVCAIENLRQRMGRRADRLTAQLNERLDGPGDVPGPAACVEAGR